MFNIIFHGTCLNTKISMPEYDLFVFFENFSLSTLKYPKNISH